MIDLVYTTTRDGVKLDGSLQRPASAAATVACDAFCLVHGAGGNFYSSTLFDSVAERLLGLGCAVLRINTRGHDGISTAVTQRGGRRLGAAYEIVDECRHDLAAWLDWLRAEVGPRIGLLGHSLGAVKALYALAQEPQLGASCVVAVSPPRLSYSWFCTSPEGPQFLEDFQRAQAHVDAGTPDRLLEVKQPLPLVIAAGGYVDKYGPEERYNYLRFVASVRCPVLVTLGGIEVANNMAFRAAAEELAAHARSSATAVIAGADHFYTSARPALLDCLESWLRRL
jgi:dienelactone hydrolase